MKRFFRMILTAMLALPLGALSAQAAPVKGRILVIASSE